jgi:hypothetical protein
MLPAGFTHVRAENLPCRALTLDIELTGPGTTITSFTLDGKTQPDHTIPATLTGPHRVAITLS